jgi:hypothetical protein
MVNTTQFLKKPSSYKFPTPAFWAKLARLENFMGLVGSYSIMVVL